MKANSLNILFIELILFICFNKIKSIYTQNGLQFDPQFFANEEIDYFVPKEELIDKDIIEKQVSKGPRSRSKSKSSRRENQNLSEDDSNHYNDFLIKARIGSSSASVKKNMAEVSIGDYQSAGVGDWSYLLSRDQSGAGARTGGAYGFAHQNNIAEAQVEREAREGSTPYERRIKFGVDPGPIYEGNHKFSNRDFKNERIAAPIKQWRNKAQPGYRGQGLKATNFKTFRDLSQEDDDQEFQFDDLPPFAKKRIMEAMANFQDFEAPQFDDQFQFEEQISQKKYKYDLEMEEFIRRKDEVDLPRVRNQVKNATSFSSDYINTRNENMPQISPLTYRRRYRPMFRRRGDYNRLRSNRVERMRRYPGNRNEFPIDQFRASSFYY